jgi:UDP-glucose:(glucosyl)LPS alpha-1,2-glucosyltransferase
MSIVTSGKETGIFALSGAYVEELTANARGGTEMMRDRIFSRLPQELLSRVNIISSRVRFIDPAKPNILWLHDTHTDPEARHLSSPASRARFAKLVYVSHWQKETYQNFLGVPPSAGVVLKNAIDVFPENVHLEKPDDGTCRLIYNTTPHRGLEILVPVFERLSPFFGGALHLDVFSSFTAYGEKWRERDAPYERMFDQCRAHPHITYHGAQPYETVREYLTKAHVQSFPSTWPETFCLSVVDAMSAGCEVVCPDFATLPETTGGLTALYPFHENISRHAEIFEDALTRAINNWHTPEACARRRAAKAYADVAFNVETRALQWQKLLYSIVGGTA